jgi:signal transduction histidine kinase
MKKKNNIFYYISVIVFIIAIVIVVSTVRFYNSLQEQLFTERQSHLIEMTQKISEVIDVTISTKQEKVDSAKIFVEQNGMTADNALDVLKEMSDMYLIDDGILMAMDSQGRYYSSKGGTGLWPNMDDLISDDCSPRIRDIRILGTKESYMVFYTKINKNIVMDSDDTYLSKIALAIPVETLKDYLSISMFVNKCYTYLINSDGRRLYKQTFSDRFIDDINVLSALENEEFVAGGDSDDLIAAVTNRENFCAEFNVSENGENYFLSTVPIIQSDWTVLLFVPTDVLGIQSDEFIHSIIAYFAGLAIAVIAIIFCLMYVASTMLNDKKLLLQQEKNNKLLAVAAKKAESASSAKSEFLAHMSHDIRTPINGILGMTHIAINNKDDPERIDDCLNKINGAADHLLTLINDVLDMSSIESGKIVIAHEPLDIRVLINNCTSIIEGQLTSRDLNLKKEFGDFAHPHVFGDELHLRQIFINILGNAVKFTPDGGEIDFRVQELSYDEGKVKYRFEFQDNGIGISEEFQTKIFEEFSQEEKGGRSTYQGTGLGMAISKKFVELMNGTITVKSKVGKGSCFTVEITFDENVKEEEIVIEEKDLDLAGMKVLLVEDNELNMEIAKVILTEEGMEVTEAANGKIACDIFIGSKPGSFEAILMDVMMPVMNGYEATKAIRESNHPEAKTIPIIAMTANAYKEDVDKALDAGMNAHVPKPIDIQMLMSVLDNYRRKGDT